MVRVVVLALAFAIAPLGINAPVLRAAETTTSPVVLDGQEIFRVRGVKVVSSEKRAQLISNRLRLLAEDFSVSPQSVTVFDDAVSTDVIAFHAGQNEQPLCQI